jgi:dCTP deaminase
MILTKNEILKEIKKGNIKITPFNKNNIGPASIDLTLGNEFRIFNHDKIDLKNFDYKKITKLIKANKITIKPNQLVLGIAKEKIKLSDSLAGDLEGRSRYARIGLLVHVSSNFVHPGINNKQVLEIKNDSNNEIVLHAGLKICQLIILECRGKASYNGKFKNQNFL